MRSADSRVESIFDRSCGLCAFLRQLGFMSQTNIQQLAEKIARVLEAETKSTDLSSLAASIETINRRLEKIEFALSSPSSNSHSTIPNPKSVHPSQERFAVIEAVADEIFANLKNEKACTFEPNGKPCDHCSMCSSRGF